MTHLESDGFLNREVEALPDAKQLADLRSNRQGLTRPEIAVLLAYAKMAFYRDVKDADLLAAPYFEADLLRYFPKAMQKELAGDIKSHRLRREIVATMITNSIINRTGFFFAHSLMRATGRPAGDIARAYVATRDAFGLRGLWAEIEALDHGAASAALQSQLYVNLNQFIEHYCRWFLHHSANDIPLDQLVATYADGIAELEAHADALLSESMRNVHSNQVTQLTGQGVPEELAIRMAHLDVLNSACDIIDIARATKKPVLEAGRIYFAIGETLKLGWLRYRASALTADSYWQQLAIKSLAHEFFDAQRHLTLRVITDYAKGKTDPVALWVEAVAEPLSRYTNFVTELRAQVALDYPMLIVALNQVQAITRG